MNLRRLALLACAALLLGCTRQTSTPAPEASATAQTPGTATPSGTSAPTYVEVATGKTSTTPPNAEFPKAEGLSTQREVDKAALPSGALSSAAGDPSGRYIAYVTPKAEQWQGTVRDTSTGKEWKVDSVAVCQCDGTRPDTGPIWSSSGRFVAFGTGNWREEKERHVVVIEPGADRVTELPKPAWLRNNRLDAATSWRPGYDVLVVEQVDGVFMYDAAARTSTHMSVGTWPRFVTRDLVQVDLLGADNKPEQTAFTDIWRGGEVARVPYVRWIPAPAIHYADGRLAIASQTAGPACTGVVVSHPALRAPSICIPGANAPTWSPDGRILAYSRVDGARSRSVVLFDPATSSEQPIADHLAASDDAQQYRTTWSVDGRHLRLDPTHIGFGV